MARSVRFEFAGAYYHVMARGNQRKAIYKDDDDRRFFLACLSECCEKTGWRVHAWVLMGNHYHLFIETPEANLVSGMKWLQNTVTRRYNVRHGKWGRLFGDRYKSVLVEGGAANYYASLWDYVHLNPARAGLVEVKEGGSILDYRWSSVAGGYGLMPQQRSKWLAAEEGLSVLGYADTAKGRREMVEHLDRRAREEGRKCGFVSAAEGTDGRRSHLRRGWYWGRQEFAEKILEVARKIVSKGKSRGYTRSKERLAHGEKEAERLLKEGLSAAGLQERDLGTLPANEKRKVAIARAIWRRTTVSQVWIAERLKMRHAANVSLALHRDKGGVKALPVALREFVKMQENAH
jgi:REP element-mobilizing transposase RayT